MKFLLCTLGSHGDIHPYLAIGRELRLRGHSVTLATSRGYRELIHEHGLQFVPIRPESRIEDQALMRRIMDSRGGPETIIRELLMPVFRDTYLDLVLPAAEADLLVSHVLTYAVPVLAEKTGKPWVSTVLSPMVFFSAHDVPVLAPAPFLARFRVLGPGFNAWLFRQLKRVSRSWTRPVAELRQELGLAAGRDPLWEGQHSPHGVLALFSGHFGPPQPDWPAPVRITGFPFLDLPEESLEPRLQQFLNEGDRPLVFALGSSAVKIAGEFYHRASRISERLQRRAVLVAGRFADELNRSLSPTQIAVPWTSYSQLFPRAAVVVHHGGVGTTAECLRAGVPQLVVPFAHDQFDNADRVSRMGCGSQLPHARVRDGSWKRHSGSCWNPAPRPSRYHLRTPSVVSPGPQPPRKPWSKLPAATASRNVTLAGSIPIRTDVQGPAGRPSNVSNWPSRSSP